MTTEPIHPGGAAPLTPAERLALAIKRPASPSPPPDEESRPGLTQGGIPNLRLPERSEPPPPPRQLEERWYQCLLCPLRAWWLCLGVGLFSAALSVCIPGLFPRLLAAQTNNLGALVLTRMGVGVLLFLIVGVPFSFLDSVLSAAVKGEVDAIRWTGGSLVVFLRTAGKWLCCFLAGPALFAGIAFAYLLYWGELTRLDWLILAELGTVGFAYWLFVLVAVADRGRLRAINPLAVMDVAHRLGWRALGVVLVAALLLQGLGWLVFAGIEEVHESTLKSVALLSAAWAIGVFGMAFFCRLLGVWSYRSRLPLAA